MRSSIVSTGLAIVLFAGACAAQESVQPQNVNNKQAIGVWRAEMEGLPAFTMVVTDEGGGLSGAIVFYLIRHNVPGEKPSATPGIPEPLLHPTFDGKTLTFQLSHRRAHPPRTLNDPPITMSFKAPETGKSEVFQFEGQPVTMTRTEY